MLLLLALVWFLNLAISIFNGVQTGKAWVESKHAGGGRRFMAWCGAIMTAIGFTWCIMIVLGLLAGAFHWLDATHLELYFSTSYVFLVPPLLFTGYAITINSWANAYRQRTVSEYGVAAYNSFASVYNTYQAVNTFGDAFGKMVDGFFKNSGKNKDGAQLMIVVLLLVVAFGGGCLIAYWLINKYAAADEPMPTRR
jgi:hypothetical protein